MLGEGAAFELLGHPTAGKCNRISHGIAKLGLAISKGQIGGQQWGEDLVGPMRNRPKEKATLESCPSASTIGGRLIGHGKPEQ